MKGIRARLLALTAALAIAGVAQPARAALVPCSFSGDLGTYVVAKLQIPGSTELSGKGWNHFRSLQAPFVDDKGYHAGVAGFVYKASTGYTAGYAIQYGGSDPPKGVVEVNGTTYFNQTVPSTAESGQQGGVLDYFNADLGGPATYYVVAFGWGARNGFTNDGLTKGRWSFGVNYQGYKCEVLSAPTDVDPPGRIVNYTQADYSGGTQVYMPLAGYGKNLSLDFDVAQNHVFGMTYEHVDGGAGFSYSTPTGNMPVRGGVFEKIVSTGGHYSSTLSYSGAEPSVQFNLLEVDL